MYQPVVPSFLGGKIIEKIPLLSILPRIDWRFFFHAWKMAGDYDELERLCDCPACKTQWLLRYQPEEREKAEEAYRLIRDAQEILREGISEERFSVSALVHFYQARSLGEGIEISVSNKSTLYLPMLRQQHESERNGCCLSMADFISPKEDYIGIFAVTVHGGDEWAEEERTRGDEYNALIIKSIADRLAEATADWLHEKIRTQFWGYADTTQAPGIRPAFGYPSLPDISLIKEVDRLIHLDKIGIRLTENCAMRPNASICGLHISHPQAFYFMVGEISEEQKENYARERGMNTDELSKWLAL